MELARRNLLQTGILAGLAAGWPSSLLAADPAPTIIVETTGGKVRGRREGLVSSFRGIPYGADTAARRFQTAVSPQPWAGVRECADFGHRAPQGSTGPGRIPPGADMKRIGAVMAAFKEGQVATGNESEDCLYLNVYTPDTSPRRKRPVLFWLHGGGFSIGSANEPVYEGGALAAHGDVVVVTINHRLYAPGYLYLGALHADFVDSGNAGQLDQVLALQWVRDNIAQFGGDPANVTIFGQSGGGMKVSTLLAMPSAKGLFHKAIIQSGPGVKAIAKGDAAAFADKLLSVLGIAPADVHRLQSLDIATLMKACADTQASFGPGHPALTPVADGGALPRNPFDPAAPEVSRQVPILIGSNHDESTLFNFGDPKFGTMTLEDAHNRFKTSLHDRGDAAFDFYTSHRPQEDPTYLVTSMATESWLWIDSIRIAERKFAQGAAPVFMYRLDWRTPIFGGIMRSPHGLDVPMVFGHALEFARLLGSGPEPQRLSRQMMDAWVAFARHGNPSTPGLAWPAYEPSRRSTMIWASQSHVVSDPDKEFRQFWSA